MAAPGGKILSLKPGNKYQYLCGTSAASSQVAGAAALIKSLGPTLLAEQIKDIILSHTDLLPQLEDKVLSKGQLNLKSLCRYLSFDYCINKGYETQNVNPRYIEDVNCDGYTDIVGFGDNFVSVSLNRKGMGFEPSKPWIYDFVNKTFWSDLNNYPRYLKDVNRDGFPDLIGFGDSEVLVSINRNGTAFETPKPWTDEFVKNKNWTDQNQCPRFITDVNNDGYPDAVGFGSTEVLVALNRQGTGFDKPQSWIKDYVVGTGWSTFNDYPRFLNDVNKDGYPDIIGFLDSEVLVSLNRQGGGFEAPKPWVADFVKNRFWSDQENYPRCVTDVNKDGYPDIVGFGDSEVLVSINNQGTGFETPVPWLADFVKNTYWTNQNESPRFLNDVNKDGYPDAVGFGDSEVLVALNIHGTGFATPVPWSDDYVKNTGWSVQDQYPRILTDIDNDGFTDILGFNKYGVSGFMSIFR